MKNSSKNNFSGKNTKQNKKDLNFNFYSKNGKSSKKNEKFLNPDTKKSFNTINENDINKRNFSSQKKRKPITKSNTRFFSKQTDTIKESLNKKNFDDWIWGKHSVFETLISERAVNRIWCTSEIYSSEKFYILLKDLKSKGVLIEEVSWSRLSQLTLGGSHQGVALQLA